MSSAGAPWNRAPAPSPTSRRGSPKSNKPAADPDDHDAPARAQHRLGGWRRARTALAIALLAGLLTACGGSGGGGSTGGGGGGGGGPGPSVWDSMLWDVGTWS